MKDKVKCWELFDCSEKACPVYGSNELRCWIVPGTHCRDETQGEFMEKIEMCLSCEAFKTNMDVNAMNETLRVCDEQFREYRTMVKDRDAELESTNIELASGLSEVFQALKEIASGDPDVRIPENGNIKLLAELKRMVNQTAEGLGEIVDLSHEFAIGLAEHFDALHRVTEGDLSARVSATSQVDLLESLRKVTNQMIESVSREINERKEAESALQESGAMFRSMTSSAQDAIMMINDEGGVSFWNEAAEKTFGYSTEEAQGKELHTLICPSQYHEAFRKGFAKFKETGQGAAVGQTLELTGLRKDGSEFPAELSLSAVKRKNKWHGIGIVRDITERKKAEASMQKAMEAAEAANQAKSEFLANMSHEIRTPMNAVIGMTDLALATELTDEQREFLETVKASGDGLLTLINDILDFSKIESKKLALDATEFSLSDNLGDTLRTLGVRAHEKGLELAYYISPDVPETAIGDPGRLRQILVNLVGNAIKFTDQGEVVVRVKKVSDKQGRICIRYTVTDTGIGIPPDKQKEIFEPFGQADTSTTRMYGGTGLGLPISKSLVEMMGGRIWMESVQGQGTTFHFTANFDRSIRPSVGPLDLKPIDIRGLRALVVDDNGTNRRILESMLANWQMEATGVESGMAALTAMERAKEEGSPYELVLLDAMMPYMDGFSVAEEVQNRQDLIGVVIMMLSSAGELGDAARCRELGIAGYLTKPIKQSELFDAMMAVLAYREEDQGRVPLVTRHSLREIQGAHVPKARACFKVLVAEDSVVNQKVVFHMLEKQGHTVVMANDGREALAALERESFDAVLMDVQMPRMDGFEATRAIRAKEKDTGRHIPIIALTAHAVKGDRERCLEEGMDAYVSKPIKADALYEEMERIAGGSRGKKVKVSVSSQTDDERAADVFDLSEALDYLDGNMELFKEIADLFFDNLPDRMSEIREAYVEGDFTAMERAAHRLKGSVSNLGAKRAFELARRIELMGRKGVAEETDAALSDLQKACDHLKVAIQGVTG